MNISQQLAQLTEKATNLTSENDKLAVREMQNKTKVSLLEAEIEKLSRRNAYRWAEGSSKWRRVNLLSSDRRS